MKRPLFTFTAIFYISISVAAAETIVPIQVKGDSVEYFHEEQKAVGTGHVSIDYEGTRLTADKITLYTSTKEAVAEGHVTLIQKGSVFTGDRAEYNYGTKIGNVADMNAEIKPSYYGKSQRVEKVSDDRYLLKNSYLTTCCGDDPFYKIQSNQIDVYPEEKVVLRNAVLLVKNVPVMFIPYYEQHFLDYNHLPVQVVPGRSADWGPFLLSKWRYHLGQSSAFTSKGNVLLDYREKRGVGYGVENFYKGDKIGHGSLKLYTIDDDKAPFNDARGRFEDSQRYRVQWRDQAKLTPTTTLTTEWNNLSDATIIKDFFYREEYERDAFPDNYISIITAKPEYTLSLLARERLDDFFTVVERNPEVRFDTHNRQFLDTPFYLREEDQFSNLKKEFANADNDLDVTRFDSNHTLSYAGHVGAVSVTPRTGSRQTVYSRVAAGDESVVRSTVDPGVDVSTRFFRTYDTYIDAFGLDYNRIRHVFAPTASYNYRPNPTILRTDLDQFDAIDAIDKQNFVRFSFENKLQTQQRLNKHSKTLVTREIARIIPFFDYDFDIKHVENVGLDTELRPYTWLGIESHITVDAYEHAVDTESVDISYRMDSVDLSIGQRYTRDSSDQVTAQAAWALNPELNFKIYERFEFQASSGRGSKEFEAVVSKTFNCVIVDFGYNHRAKHGNTFYFMVRLKAFRSIPFKLSQSYNAPKTASRPSAWRL